MLKGLCHKMENLKTEIVGMWISTENHLKDDKKKKKESIEHVTGTSSR